MTGERGGEANPTECGGDDDSESDSELDGPLGERALDEACAGDRGDLGYGWARTDGWRRLCMVASWVDTSI